MRVVIDSNVFLSALIGAAPQLVVQAFGDDEIDVVVSPQLIAELEAVLARPKFAADDPGGTERIRARIRDQAELAADPEPP